MQLTIHCRPPDHLIWTEQTTTHKDTHTLTHTSTSQEEEAAYYAQTKRKQKKANLDELRKHGPLTGISLGVFPPTHPFRVGIAWITRNPLFENLVLLCIIVSCIMLAWDTPLLEPGSTTWAVITYADRVFTVVFVLEMVLKVITFGLFSTPQAYLKVHTRTRARTHTPPPVRARTHTHTHAHTRVHTRACAHAHAHARTSRTRGTSSTSRSWCPPSPPS